MTEFLAQNIYTKRMKFDIYCNVKFSMILFLQGVLWRIVSGQVVYKQKRSEK